MILNHIYSHQLFMVAFLSVGSEAMRSCLAAWMLLRDIHGMGPVTVANEGYEGSIQDPCNYDYCWL